MTTEPEPAPASTTLPPVVVPPDYVPAAESSHELYQVATHSFVGPLDLLLFLIRRHELDVFDIPMAFVCSRYLEVLHALKTCDLDVAAEFLAMAAELLQIKSRMLLPREKVAEEAAEEADPRAALVRRLLRLAAYQRAARALATRPQLDRDVFARVTEPVTRSPSALRKMASLDLVATMARLRAQRRPSKRHAVVVEQVPLKQRMGEVLRELCGREEPLMLAGLLGAAEQPIDVLVIFLAVLELAKGGLLHIVCADEDEGEGSGPRLLPRIASLTAAQETLGRTEVDAAWL